nr:aspartyl-phosphate phosphatase Spo0E family protein [Neobacillus sp. Marseille-Q6967]
MELIVSKEQLKLNIENLRKTLIDTGLKQGFNSSTTIRLSQELDNLIFKYQKLR